jgi:Transglutaminase-like superfamily
MSEMKHLRKFLRLPAVERWLLIKAAFLLEAIKLGMWLLPFRTLRRFISVMIRAPIKPRRTDHSSTQRVVWAIEVASRRTPGVKTCLAQALATQVLLARRGYPALLHIGVVLGEQRQLQAHAWVVTEEGKVVIGESEPGRYDPLAVLDVEGLKRSRNQNFK